MFGPFWENIRISFSSILANKSRSILSVLGIVIGVLSVTLMGTMISGLDSTFEKSMSNFRSDILFVSRMNWFGGEWDWWELRNRPKIKEEYGDWAMPQTADNLAQDYQITREEADIFALNSQNKYQLLLYIYVT